MAEIMSKSIVTTFGRCNPPTTGHLKLIEKVASVAQGGEYNIYVSHSVNPKKNPLVYEAKVSFMREMFSEYANNITESEARNPLEVLQDLYRQGYTDVKFVAGSDRVDEYTERLTKYNGTEPNSLYNFNSLEIVSAGERDPDAEGVSGMSASKMRQAAAEGLREDFQLGLPEGYNGDKLYTAVRKGMLIEQAKVLSEKLKRAYGVGLSKSTQDKRSAQFDKQAKKRDDDPTAYKPAPGDARAETKPSKHKSILAHAGEEGTDELVKNYKDDTPGQLTEISAAAEKNLRAKAKKSGIPYGILKQVYNRGMAAWKTGHRPGAGQQQWAHARVNSFTRKAKGTWGGADKDLAAKARKAKKKAKKNEAVDLLGRISVIMESRQEKTPTLTEYINSIIEYMLDQGMNIKPLPSIKVRYDEDNATDFFGKTAHYDPNNREVVLYATDRHPKDICRSFAHEMIHHIQNLEDRLGNYTSTDTTEDSNLQEIEKEAYTLGNITFRNWEDNYKNHTMKNKAVSVTEGVKKKSESWEDGYKRRVVKTTDADHKKDGYNWRIKGKERNEVTIKLYKTKPSFAEFKKQMRRVAGHEFGG
jgi:hypothetical protein